jgi:hypothetical protein
MKKVINNNVGKITFLFSLLTFLSVTKFWWLSIFSLIYYIWNFFYQKKILLTTTVLFSLNILLLIINFAIIKPTNEWAEKVQAEWNKTAFDSSYIPGAQQNLNVITRNVEKYKSFYGTYPSQLSDIQNISIEIFNMDMSYRIKQKDGQTRPIEFYYEKIDSNKFYLAGIGKDGKFKTSDDLLPQISLKQEKTTGLQKYVLKSLTEKEIKEEKGLIEMSKKLKKIQNKQNN